MNLPLPPLPDLIQRVLQLVPPSQPLYLVGGAVRDWLRHRPVHDWDFAVPHGALDLAQRVARALGGAYIPLDPQHGTARVVLRAPRHAPASPGRTLLDFTDFRAPTLEADLRLRDFTINALALDLRAPQRLIDPLGGLRDLREGVLRACGPTAFADDPIRIVRGVRLALALGLRMEKATQQAMRQAAPKLPRVSAERQRDELFRLLEGSAAAQGIRVLDALGALPYLLPELPPLQGVPQSLPHRDDVWTHTLRVLEHLDRLLEALAPRYDEDKAADFVLGLTVLRLGRYRSHLAEHLRQGPHRERTLVGLLRLGALYHDTGKPATAHQNGDGQWRFPQHAEVSARLAQTRGRQLALSNAEIRRLVTMVRYHGRPWRLTRTGRPPDRRQVHRFFRETGPAGVEVGLLSLADVLAMYGPYLPQDLWERHLTTVRTLWEGWWERHDEVVAPPPLVDGHRLMAELGLAPGPTLGRLLAWLREEQAAGEIHTPAQALTQARRWLEQNQTSTLEGEA